MTKGINADLAPLDSCSQPVFKWSPLLLFHFPRSACVPEIINCSNSNFNLGLEVWSFMTPCSSSNSLLLPTGLPLSHAVVQALLLLLCQLQCLSLFFFLFFFNILNYCFAGKKLNHFPERADEHLAGARGAGNSGTARFDINKPFDLHKCLAGSTARCILSMLKSTVNNSPAASCPRQLVPSHVPVLEALVWYLLIWIEELMWLN